MWPGAMPLSIHRRQARHGAVLGSGTPSAAEGSVCNAESTMSQPNEPIPPEMPPGGPTEIPQPPGPDIQPEPVQPEMPPEPRVPDIGPPGPDTVPIPGPDVVPPPASDPSPAQIHV